MRGQIGNLGFILPPLERDITEREAEEPTKLSHRLPSQKKKKNRTDRETAVTLLLFYSALQGSFGEPRRGRLTLRNINCSTSSSASLERWRRRMLPVHEKIHSLDMLVGGYESRCWATIARFHHTWPLYAQ